MHVRMSRIAADSLMHPITCMPRAPHLGQTVTSISKTQPSGVTFPKLAAISGEFIRDIPWLFGLHAEAIARVVRERQIAFVVELVPHGLFGQSEALVELLLLGEVLF
jgi:hypothetical protein